MFQADFWKKFSFGRFWPKTANFGHFWPFLAKKSGFWTFSSNIRTSDSSKTWSETWDNRFESSNGSVVSRKILVIINIILLFLKLWDYPPLFLCVFLIWPPPRDLSIARLFYLQRWKVSKFCQDKNCHWPFINNKISSNNKN